MYNNTLEINELIDLCIKGGINTFDMYAVTARLTDNFKEKKLELFIKELGDTGNNLTFEIIEPTITNKNFKTYSIKGYLKSYILELKSQNINTPGKDIDNTIKNINDIINSTDINKKITVCKILNPEGRIIEYYPLLIDLYNIAIEEWDKITVPVASKGKKIQQIQPTFSDLFKPNFRDKTELIKLLYSNGYVDVKGEWIIKTDMNEPAKLYHYLNEKKVLTDIKFTYAIKCFYKEFGCEVVEKHNGSLRTTTRKNAIDAKLSVNEKEFDKILLKWTNKK